MKEGDEENGRNVNTSANNNGHLALLMLHVKWVFSCMNNQKTKLRTSLCNQSLDDIMRICIDGPDLKKVTLRAMCKTGLRLLKEHVT